MLNSLKYLARSVVEADEPQEDDIYYSMKEKFE
jgi:hypothetical protein